MRPPFAPLRPGLLLPFAVLALVACGENEPSPTEPSLDVTAAAASALVFRHINAGGDQACGVTTDNRAYCWGAVGEIVSGDITRPNPVAINLRFLEVRTGIRFACGLTTDNRVYCWGYNLEGQLGNGSTIQFSATPVAIAGGRRYRLLRVGAGHACGVTLAGVTFCWGLNNNGQLGDGTTTLRRSPVKVLGGLVFDRLSSGYYHNCGLTAAGKAYCWGYNQRGQLGDRTSTTRRTPVAVYGGIAFQVIAAGGSHTCGIAAGGSGYCWGANNNGQLGDGTTNRHGRPLPVAGALSFSRMSAGGGHTCGVTTTRRAWCWGYNWFGQVGNGNDASSGDPFQILSPVAVLGNLAFDVVIASNGLYTCGITTAGAGYCWGENTQGYLGDGTKTHRNVPTPIAPPA